MYDNKKIEVVIVDLSVKKTSPAGSCVLSQIIGLSEHFKIHLFSSEIEPNILKHVTFHHVRVLRFPLLLRYIQFTINVNFRIRKIVNFQCDNPIIQTTQGQYPKTTISYAHFCHKAYLKKHWSANTSRGLTRLVRKLNHTYNAQMEAKAFAHAKLIVVPSEGLQFEIAKFYPNVKDKIKVINNPVDIKKFNKPTDFDSSRVRKGLGISKKERVIVFVALGDFARKGLPLLMQSLSIEAESKSIIKILVVGGKPKEILVYKKMGLKLGIAQSMVFVGFQNDIRPFLWASDIFALPSQYETFSLVSAQAAAAGLPLLVSQLYGVENYLKDNHNGWLVERNIEAISLLIKEIIRGDHDLIKMGASAKRSVRHYNHNNFREAWHNLYKDLVH